MKRNRRFHHAALRGLAAVGLGVVVTCSAGCAQQPPPPPAATPAPAQETPRPAITATAPPVVGGGQFSPHVGQTFPTRVLWGVAHVHTGYSFDSGMFGVTLTPDDLSTFISDLKGAIVTALSGEVTVDVADQAEKADALIAQAETIATERAEATEDRRRVDAQASGDLVGRQDLLLRCARCTDCGRVH